jgi:tRNA nucleotidyltransferase (CCA-adding enzyme)
MQASTFTSPATASSHNQKNGTMANDNDNELPFKVPTIQLEEREAAVLDLIDTFTHDLANTRHDLPPVECRVAGGWVRDKLLGISSEDLDICISSLTGHHFATLLEPYLQSHPASSAFSATTKIAKIQANPDQSKHLETARMHILGLEVDLVQLRSEEYANSPSSMEEDSPGASTSRIPTSVKFGTPLEDALRRDITINTLFYNVHTRKVEDFTGKGLQDLLSSHPLIRTPLEPLQTFLDDPLRILRCIRFASRLNFPLDESIKPAVENERVKKALLNKVSKERIGVELDKMLKAKNPLLSLQLINHLSLYHTLFSPLPNIQEASPIPADAPDAALLACTALSNIEKASDGRISQLLLAPLLDSSSPQAKIARKRLWLALVLAPLRDLTFIEKQKTVPLTDTIIRDSIKLSGGDRLFVSHNHASHRKIREAVRQSPSLRDTPNERSTLGFLLRDLDVHDPINDLSWRASVLHALVLDLASSSEPLTLLPEIIEPYLAFIQRIEDLQLDTRAYEKTRLDGSEVIKLLGIKGGPITSVLIQTVMKWQLDNPDGTKEECAEFIKREYEMGNIKPPELPMKFAMQKKGAGGGSENTMGNKKKAKVAK